MRTTFCKTCGNCVEKPHLDGFRLNTHRGEGGGIHLHFPNGLGLSVQLGAFVKSERGCRCQPGTGDKSGVAHWACPCKDRYKSAEIAVFYGGDIADVNGVDGVAPGWGDLVFNYVSTSTVGRLAGALASATPEEARDKARLAEIVEASGIPSMKMEDSDDE